MDYIINLLPNAPIIPPINSIELPAIPDISYPISFLTNIPKVTLPDNRKFRLDAIKEEIKPGAITYSTYLSGLTAVPTLPATLDLRNNLGPVRDQGEIGSCTSFGTSCMKEWQESFDNEYSGYLSPAFIYINRPKPTEPGMIISDACDILARLGTCKDSTLPYSVLGPDDISANSKTPAIIPASAKTEANKYRISTSVLIRTVNDLKTALYLNGPCPFGISIYGDINGYVGNHGVRPRMWISSAPYNTYLGGHCMCFVGYNSNGFIIRNSWGTYYNPLNSTTDMIGYDYLPYSDFNLVFSCYSTTDLKPIPIPPTPPTPTPPTPNPPTPTPPTPTPPTPPKPTPPKPTPPATADNTIAIGVGVAVGAILLFTFFINKK